MALSLEIFDKAGFYQEAIAATNGGAVSKTRYMRDLLPPVITRHFTRAFCLITGMKKPCVYRVGYSCETLVYEAQTIQDWLAALDPLSVTLRSNTGRFDDDGDAIFADKETMIQPKMMHDIWRSRAEFARGEGQADCVVFDPPMRTPPNHLGTRVFNLYRGAGITREDCARASLRAPGLKLWQKHLRNEFCGGDKEIYLFLTRWMASLVQFPGDRISCFPGVSGPPGSGKSLLYLIQEMVIGGAYCRSPGGAKALLDRFNAFLEGTILVYACESMFSGSSRSESAQAWKKLITDKYLDIEHKGCDKPAAVAVARTTRLQCQNKSANWQRPRAKV